jgi:putative endonuclease
MTASDVPGETGADADPSPHKRRGLAPVAASKASTSSASPSRRASSGRGLNLPPGPGRAGEAAAESQLRSLGYRVLVRNYRTREGEVDIVALDGETYVFIEVKARRGSVLKFGQPEESLTRAKQARLVAAAQSFLAEKGLADADWRIDFVAVELDRAGRVARAEVFKGAVGE